MQHLGCLAVLYLNLARFRALSPQALAQAWRSTEALRLRWGPVSAWGITASPTVEQWFAWLEEAENLGVTWDWHLFQRRRSWHGYLLQRPTLRSSFRSKMSLLQSLTCPCCVRSRPVCLVAKPRD